MSYKFILNLNLIKDTDKYGYRDIHGRIVHNRTYIYNYDLEAYTRRKKLLDKVNKLIDLQLTQDEIKIYKMSTKASQEEIANLLDLSQAGVSKAYRRALEKLKQQFKLIEEN